MSKVIMYHYIRSFDKRFPYFKFLDLKDFQKKIKFFSKNKEFIKLDDDLNKEYYKNKYLLTFDDGLKEHLEVAKFLNKRNISALFFISGLPIEKKEFLPIHKIHLIFGKLNSSEILDIFKKFKIKFNQKNIFSFFKKQKNFLGKAKNTEEEDKKIFLKTFLNNIDQKNKTIVNNIFNHCISKKNQKKIFKNYYMNSNDILELDKLGMKIGGHSYHHRVLSTLTYGQQKKDINNTTKILSQIIKKKIKYFCYPYGGLKVFNQKTFDILEQEIEWSFNVESKDWSKRSNRLLVPRFDCNEFKFGKVFEINEKNSNYFS